MSASSAALAHLVTQAPPDDTPKTKAKWHSDPDPPSTSVKEESRSCRCFRWRRRTHEPKLAAVVPVPLEEYEKPPAPETQVQAAVAESDASVAPTAPTLASTEPLETDSRRSSKQARSQEGQLGLQAGPNIGRKTLVLDLDETLVHSSFRAVYSADIVITVELDGEHHRIYVRKRPGVDTFLQQVAELYEVVVYTASMSKYANPLLDELDKEHVVSHRLFREACTRHPSGYVKDLSRLGRDLKDVIIIDNSPTCYALQPHNAIPIRTWRDDPTDHELLDLIPILNSLAVVEDVPMVLKQIVWSPDD